MNGPEAALYSSGPGTKPRGGEPLTVMVTVGTGDKEKKRIHCAVLTETIHVHVMVTI